MRKKILYGAGKYGILALKEFGKENVAYFVDSNYEKIGKQIDGIRILNIDELNGLYDENLHEVVITIKNGEKIAEQLDEINIKYTYYSANEYVYYPTNDLVVNLYDKQDGFWNNSEDNIKLQIEAVNKLVEEYSNKENLFNHVEIETINRCNGGCSFCPVSAKKDPRKFVYMEEELFRKIITELGELNYDGIIALFSNNEPFLDDRIIEFHKYAREKLPQAHFVLFTNGTLLTLDKFIEIIDYLDELVIDNYNQNLELIQNNKKIVQYCEEHGALRNKVTVVIRKVDEVLSTRGGAAPNARKVTYPNAKCILPFKQLIIRPDGKVSLCCNDPLGKCTLGDLTKESILEVWMGRKFKEVRKTLSIGRGEWKHCEHCDVFSTG